MEGQLVLYIWYFYIVSCISSHWFPSLLAGQEKWKPEICHPGVERSAGNVHRLAWRPSSSLTDGSSSRCALKRIFTLFSPTRTPWSASRSAGCRPGEHSTGTSGKPSSCRCSRGGGERWGRSKIWVRRVWCLFVLRVCSTSFGWLCYCGFFLWVSKGRLYATDVFLITSCFIF